MSASVAVKEEAKKIATADMPTSEPMDAEARLAVAVEALAAIAGENDLTCLRALFRMRRKAEEALDHIGMRRTCLHSHTQH